MIDPETISRIIDTADIVEVVSDYVTLKRRGANHIGLCPFHNEKTPSFNVSAARGIFKCFGCGKGGNSVNFVMEHDQLTYPEALKLLAKKYNIDVVEEELSNQEIQQKNERESLLVVTAYAQKYFSDVLLNTEEGKAIGLSYFKERGFRDQVIEKFQLGYSPEDRDIFTRTALKKGYKQEFLVTTGLTIQKEDRVFDRFSGRVMFPIHSLSGNVIAFGGRTLLSDKTVAKYVNSPESDLYYKSKILYGIFQSKKSIVAKDNCYLVEGYTDVISLHQAGVENVVASSGTSLTSDQIRLIKRFTKNITVLYDGDAAGIKASLRGIDMILEEGMNVKVLLFPDGEDPDSYSRRVSNSEFLAYITENEVDFINFKVKLLLEEAQKDPVKRANLIIDIVTSISIIPENITRSVYIKECSTLLKISEQVLYEEVNKRRRKSAEQNYNKQVFAPENKPSPQNFTLLSTSAKIIELEEKELIKLLLNYGEHSLFVDEEGKVIMTVAQYIADELHTDNIEFVVPVLKQIFEEYELFLLENKPVDSRHFVNHPDAEVSTIAADLCSKPHVLSKIHKSKGVLVETEEMKLLELVPKAIIEYKQTLILIHREELSEKIKEAQEVNNTELYMEMLGQLIALNKLKMVLAENLGKRTII